MIRARFSQLTHFARNHRRKLMILVLIMPVCAVLAAQSSLTQTATSEATGGAGANELIASSPGLAENSTSEQLHRVLITLRATGFDPREITVPQGRFLLRVDNKSGLEGLSLRLSREGGDRTHDLALPRGKHKWRENLNLVTGTYWLTEEDHPHWRCRLTVGP